MKELIKISHRNIDLEWYGWCMLCRKGEFKPLKLCYNGTVGWWIGHKIFLSFNTLKNYLK